MQTLFLPLSNLLRNQEGFKRLFTHLKCLHTRSGIWTVNTTSTPWVSRSALVSRRREVPVGQLPAGNMCTSSSVDKTSWLWSVYNETKQHTQDLIPVISKNFVNPDTIFANNQMSLQDIEIYGFDYDYTLAFYSSHLHTLIFNIARDILINEHRYPEGLREYDYIPNFVIRGLHYDVQKSSHGHTMKQFMDIFSLPEMTLLLCVNDYFMKHNIDYEPVHLYKDVKEAIGDVHVRGIMYRAVEADNEKYICYGEQTHAVLRKLSKNGKKMFLITNSPFDFVNRGMNYIVGKDWRDLFDVVIVQADKPGFFNDRRKPFRRVTDKGVLLWDRIHHLEKGQIYKQGNLYEFLRLTGWRGSKVLYFGDHIYSDLADLTLKHGWRTGAIIPELRKEIKIMNTEELRTKDIFNAQFGSLFRTYHNPTYFTRRLSRFADIYMASLSCLLNYDLQHTFYPRRTPLQHESPIWPEQTSTGAMNIPFRSHSTTTRPE
ncbi:hypothetical protein cypCar_00039740 [Cyprinus carpio]|nr:hypothetical protein cypCar_00039740 [Cyprinus carpio]